MVGLRLATLGGLASTAVLAAEEAEELGRPYVAPEVEGLHWAETFDGDVWSRWKSSSQEKYSGKFTVEPRQREALVGDVGLFVPVEARHYGAHATFKPLVGRKEAPFVVQYEVRMQEGLSCGGAYLKLFDSAGAEDFSADTPYVIMFGPDRCGATDKVHFILKHRNPKTGVWEEKHMKDPPRVPSDSLTHLYGLIINPDNTFEIHIDGEQQATGNLLSSMQPPINPPQEIDDPQDSKPLDWVDEAKMDDPTATKPDDWDEEEPMTIPDPSVSMPEGWLEDQPRQIPDPSSTKPEDWDDEEDGEWEPPTVPNPACTVGCGRWDHPKISNPKYKGKWYAPKIDNPNYKGRWAPRQIPNPDYFFDEAPSVLPKIDAVGIDIWTMSKGLIFDNIVISDDVEKAAAFAEMSFRLRKALEDKQQPKPQGGGVLEQAMGFVLQNLLATGMTLLVVLLTTIWCCCSGRSAPRAPTEEEKKALRQKRRAEQAAEKAKEQGEREQEKPGGSEEEKEDAAAEDEAAGSSAKEEAAEEKEESEEKEEGGLGDLRAEDD